MSRPSFTAAWHASRRIFDPVNSADKVAKVIGGKVAENILPLGQQGKWQNTCAVRMSYILNQSGVHIPFMAGRTVSGAHHQWYFHYVRDVIAFLKQRWGQPDIIAPYPDSGGGPLSGKRGVIMFEVSGWGDATGHATLWDGTRCYDHCYWNNPSANYRTTKANFWSLS